jgi:hypothetical protein
MPTHRIVFLATSTNELRFEDSTVATDGDLTVVLQNGERRFCVPTRNVIAIERLIPQAVPAPGPDLATPGAPLADEDAS